MSGVVCPFGENSSDRAFVCVWLLLLVCLVLVVVVTFKTTSVAVLIICTFGRSAFVYGKMDMRSLTCALILVRYRLIFSPLSWRWTCNPPLPERFLTLHIIVMLSPVCPYPCLSRDLAQQIVCVTYVLLCRPVDTGIGSSTASWRFSPLLQSNEALNKPQSARSVSIILLFDISSARSRSIEHLRTSY